MNPEITKLLSELAQKMGTTVEYLWPKLVAYARAEAITELATCAVIFLISIPLVVFSYRAGEKDEWDGPGPAIALVASSFIALISVLVASGTIPNIVVPEAAAIKMLLGK